MPHVTLDHYTPLWVCAQGIRQCWQSQDKSDTVEQVCGPNDKALIERIGNKFKHASTLEHLNYNFTISGISRALLQELARHRHASLSVKSTRYTLKELKEEQDLDKLMQNSYFYLPGPDHSLSEFPEAKEVYGKYLVLTNNYFVDTNSILALCNLQKALQHGIANDKVKYCMPEAYKTSLAWTINARSLQNFLSLRTAPAALWEIRELAQTIYDVLPEEHKYLFTDSIYKGDTNDN